MQTVTLSAVDVTSGRTLPVFYSLAGAVTIRRCSRYRDRCVCTEDRGDDCVVTLFYRPWDGEQRELFTTSDLGRQPQGRLSRGRWTSPLRCAPANGGAAATRRSAVTQRTQRTLAPYCAWRRVRKARGVSTKTPYLRVPLRGTDRSRAASTAFVSCPNFYG